MPVIGPASRRRLDTCHIDLQWICEHAIQYYDFAVVCGHRGEREQNAAFEMGNSMTPWPKSKHNRTPSDAVDLVPWPRVYDAHHIDFGRLAGHILTVAAQLGIQIRWGADWDRDGTSGDEKFLDMGHFERVL